MPLAGAPDEATLVRYPDQPDKDPRRHDLTTGHVWIEEEDAGMASFRLKDLVDVDRHEDTLIAGAIERQDQRPIVHWTVDASKDATLVLAENGITTTEISGRLEPHDFLQGPLFSWAIGYAVCSRMGGC